MLLVKLGLLPQLRAALGERGKLVLFSDVWEEIQQSARELQSLAQRVELEQLEGQLERLRGHPRVRIEEADGVSDEEWAIEHGLALIEDGAKATSLSPRALTHELQRQQLIDRFQCSQLLRTLPQESEETVLQTADLPDMAVLADVPLHHFSAANALEALIGLFPGGIMIGPSTSTFLWGLRRKYREGVAAADLSITTQQALGSGIADGWVDTSVVRPLVRELPSVRASENPTLIRDPLERGFSYREALANDSTLWLLTADFFVNSALGMHAEQVMRLAWRDPEHYLDVSERLLGVDNRVVGLPEVLSRILVESAFVKRVPELLRLGFGDAPRARNVLALVEGFGGLDSGEPKRQLDQLERMAQLVDHAGAPLAGIHVAELYAEVIWEAFRRSDWEPRARSIAEVLLLRVSSISPTLLERTIYLVMILVVGTPQHSFEPTKDKDVLSLSQRSPGGRLFEYLHEFRRAGQACEGAYCRAVRAVWRFLDQQFYPEGPTRAHSGPLLLPIFARPTHLKVPEIEAPAILSANWVQRPLSPRATGEGLSIEESLRARSCSGASGARFEVHLE